MLPYLWICLVNLKYIKTTVLVRQNTEINNKVIKLFIYELDSTCKVPRRYHVVARHYNFCTYSYYTAVVVISEDTNIPLIISFKKGNIAMMPF